MSHDTQHYTIYIEKNEYYFKKRPLLLIYNK